MGVIFKQTMQTVYPLTRSRLLSGNLAQANDLEVLGARSLRPVYLLFMSSVIGTAVSAGYSQGEN